MNNENLKPFDQRAESEQREIRVKGGIASGEARRKKRTLRELCEYIGTLKSDSPLVKDLPEEMQTNDAAIAAAQVLQAAAGDTKAATWVRDTKGESQQNVNVTTEKPFVLIDYEKKPDA